MNETEMFEELGITKEETNNIINMFANWLKNNPTVIYGEANEYYRDYEFKYVKLDEDQKSYIDSVLSNISPEEVDNLINTINGLNFSVVEILPTENISTNTIYLVPLTSATTNNIYEEFIYLNNQWESIGTTQIDLSNYITKDTAEEITSTKTWLNNQEIRFKNPSNLNYRFHTLTDGRLRLGDNSDRTLMAFDQNGNVDLGTIRPKASTGVNIGGSGNSRWQDIYFQGSLKDDTYSIKLSDIVTNETFEDKLIEKGISDNVAVIIDLTEAEFTSAYVQETEEGEE